MQFVPKVKAIKPPEEKKKVKRRIRIKEQQDNDDSHSQYDDERFKLEISVLSQQEEIN